MCLSCRYPDDFDDDKDRDRRGDVRRQPSHLNPYDDNKFSQTDYYSNYCCI
jgi:hypothetical protein